MIDNSTNNKKENNTNKETKSTKTTKEYQPSLYPKINTKTNNEEEIEFLSLQRFIRSGRSLYLENKKRLNPKESKFKSLLETFFVRTKSIYTTKEKIYYLKQNSIRQAKKVWVFSEKQQKRQTKLNDGKKFERSINYKIAQIDFQQIQLLNKELNLLRKECHQQMYKEQAKFKLIVLQLEQFLSDFFQDFLESQQSTSVNNSQSYNEQQFNIQLKEFVDILFFVETNITISRNNCTLEPSLDYLSKYKSCLDKIRDWILKLSNILFNQTFIKFEDDLFLLFHFLNCPQSGEWGSIFKVKKNWNKLLIFHFLNFLNLFFYPIKLKKKKILDIEQDLEIGSEWILEKSILTNSKYSSGNNNKDNSKKINSNENINNNKNNKNNEIEKEDEKKNKNEIEQGNSIETMRDFKLFEQDYLNFCDQIPFKDFLNYLLDLNNDCNLLEISSIINYLIKIIGNAINTFITYDTFSKLLGKILIDVVTTFVNFMKRLDQQNKQSKSSNKSQLIIDKIVLSSVMVLLNSTDSLWSLIIHLPFGCVSKETVWLIFLKVYTLKLNKKNNQDDEEEVDVNKGVENEEDDNETGNLQEGNIEEEVIIENIKSKIIWDNFLAQKNYLARKQFNYLLKINTHPEFIIYIFSKLANNGNIGLAESIIEELIIYCYFNKNNSIENDQNNNNTTTYEPPLIKTINIAFEEICMKTPNLISFILQIIYQKDNNLDTNGIYLFQHLPLNRWKPNQMDFQIFHKLISGELNSKKMSFLLWLITKLNLKFKKKNKVINNENKMNQQKLYIQAKDHLEIALILGEIWCKIKNNSSFFDYVPIFQSKNEKLSAFCFRILFELKLFNKYGERLFEPLNLYTDQRLTFLFSFLPENNQNFENFNDPFITTLILLVTDISVPKVKKNKFNFFINNKEIEKKKKNDINEKLKEGEKGKEIEIEIEIEKEKEKENENEKEKEKEKEKENENENEKEKEKEKKGLKEKYKIQLNSLFKILFSTKSYFILHKLSFLLLPTILKPYTNNQNNEKIINLTKEIFTFIIDCPKQINLEYNFSINKRIDNLNSNLITSFILLRYKYESKRNKVYDFNYKDLIKYFLSLLFSFENWFKNDKIRSCLNSLFKLCFALDSKILIENCLRNIYKRKFYELNNEQKNKTIFLKLDLFDNKKENDNSSDNNNDKTNNNNDNKTNNNNNTNILDYNITFLDEGFLFTSRNRQNLMNEVPYYYFEILLIESYLNIPELIELGQIIILDKKKSLNQIIKKHSLKINLKYLNLWIEFAFNLNSEPLLSTLIWEIIFSYYFLNTSKPLLWPTNSEWYGYKLFESIDDLNNIKKKCSLKLIELNTHFKNSNKILSFLFNSMKNWLNVKNIQDFYQYRENINYDRLENLILNNIFHSKFDLFLNNFRSNDDDNNMNNNNENENEYKNKNKLWLDLINYKLLLNGFKDKWLIFISIKEFFQKEKFKKIQNQNNKKNIIINNSGPILDLDNDNFISNNKHTVKNQKIEKNNKKINIQNETYLFNFNNLFENSNDKFILQKNNISLIEQMLIKKLNEINNYFLNYQKNLNYHHQLDKEYIQLIQKLFINQAVTIPQQFHYGITRRQKVEIIFHVTKCTKQSTIIKDIERNRNLVSKYIDKSIKIEDGLCSTFNIIENFSHELIRIAKLNILEPQIFGNINSWKQFSTLWFYNFLEYYIEFTNKRFPPIKYLFDDTIKSLGFNFLSNDPHQIDKLINYMLNNPKLIHTFVTFFNPSIDQEKFPYLYQEIIEILKENITKNNGNNNTSNTSDLEIIYEPLIHSFNFMNWLKNNPSKELIIETIKIIFLNILKKESKYKIIYNYNFNSLNTFLNYQFPEYFLFILENIINLSISNQIDNKIWDIFNQINLNYLPLAIIQNCSTLFKEKILNYRKSKLIQDIDVFKLFDDYLIKILNFFTNLNKVLILKSSSITPKAVFHIFYQFYEPFLITIKLNNKISYPFSKKTIEQAGNLVDNFCLNLDNLIPNNDNILMYFLEKIQQQFLNNIYTKKFISKLYIKYFSCNLNWKSITLIENFLNYLNLISSNHLYIQLASNITFQINWIQIEQSIQDNELKIPFLISLFNLLLSVIHFNPIEYLDLKNSLKFINNIISGINWEVLNSKQFESILKNHLIKIKFQGERDALTKKEIDKERGKHLKDQYNDKKNYNKNQKKKLKNNEINDFKRKNINKITKYNPLERPKAIANEEERFFYLILIIKEIIGEEKLIYWGNFVLHFLKISIFSVKDNEKDNERVGFFSQLINNLKDNNESSLDNDNDNDNNNYDNNDNDNDNDWFNNNNTTLLKDYSNVSINFSIENFCLIYQDLLLILPKNQSMVYDLINLIQMTNNNEIINNLLEKISTFLHSNTNLLLTFLKCSCNQINNYYILSLLLELILTIYFDLSDFQIENVIGIIQFPENEFPSFLNECIQNGSIYTLFIYQLQQMKNENFEKVNLFNLPSQILFWIKESKFQNNQEYKLLFFIYLFLKITILTKKIGTGLFHKKQNTQLIKLIEFIKLLIKDNSILFISKKNSLPLDIKLTFQFLSDYLQLSLNKKSIKIKKCSLKKKSKDFKNNVEFCQNMLLKDDTHIDKSLDYLLTLVKKILIFKHPNVNKLLSQSIDYNWSLLFKEEKF
ncbi:myb-like protein x [Anaeramoeba flamelloides]|uniref:Myb-like protein x n=1 Tax=Anaeramoeba flamelloides TaxID=1746091 RepID=A0ABQ8YFY4_9EUKA|nr:myb-like protein x [Anaeramoeba flamelloides]